MATIAERSVPITTIFPEANATFHRTLLSLSDDQDVVMQLERMLRTKTPQPDPVIARITEMVTTIEKDQHLRTVAAVAHAYHMSERTLQQLFQTYVGVGIKWVIMRARFLEAVQHAYTSEKPDWTEISINLGYSTPSHFTNDFKKLVGMPPSRYVALQKSL
jgi:AraC-like DNA-binding protein